MLAIDEYNTMITDIFWIDMYSHNNKYQSIKHPTA